MNCGNCKHWFCNPRIEVSDDVTVGKCMVSGVYTLDNNVCNVWELSNVATVEAEQRWIPVSERLPESGAPILFYDSILEIINKGTCTAWNADNTNLHWFTDDNLFYFGNRSEYITHWMPLPEPPIVYGKESEE